MAIKLIDYKDLEKEERKALLNELVQPLYLTSFPKEERREWGDFCRLLEDNEAFALKIIAHQEGEKLAFVGFLSLWTLSDEWLFVEHFALLPKVRNQGFGAKALSSLQRANPTKTIFLECEPPSNELARRRLNFYAREGFCILSKSYEQPSYYPQAEGELSQNLNLYLLASQTVSDLQVPKVIRLIYRLVYALD